MDAIEKRARELLAEALRQRNEDRLAGMAEIPQGLDQIATSIAVGAIIAALTLPAGYVHGRPILVAATRIRRLASAATPVARKAYIKSAEMVEMAVISGRPEAPDSTAVVMVSKAEAEELSQRRVARMEGAE